MGWNGKNKGKIIKIESSWESMNTELTWICKEADIENEGFQKELVTFQQGILMPSWINLFYSVICSWQEPSLWRCLFVYPDCKSVKTEGWFRDRQTPGWPGPLQEDKIMRLKHEEARNRLCILFYCLQGIPLPLDMMCAPLPAAATTPALLGFITWLKLSLSLLTKWFLKCFLRILPAL